MNSITLIKKTKGDRNMKKATLIILTLLVIGLVSISTIAHADLLTNPGFENVDPIGWASWGDSKYVTDQYRNGAQSGHAWTWDSSDGKFEQWIDVTAGVEYKASGYIKSTQMTDGAAWIQFQWDGNGTAYESAKLTSVGDWTYFETAFVEAPTGVATAKVAYILQAPTNQIANDVYFDDANFDAVPEPASLMLLGSGLLGLFGISRRKK